MESSTTSQGTCDTPRSGRIGADPLREVYALLTEEHADAAPAAMVVFLSMLSGWLSKPLAAGVQGPSHSGKTYLVRRTAELFPPAQVLLVSQASVAGLFASKGARVLIGDEFISDPEFARVRRQLISTGTATRILATAGGQARRETIDRPIVFIDCQLADQDVDYQDASRMLYCPLPVTEGQMRHVARRTAARVTRTGRKREADWQAKADSVRDLVTGVAPDVEVVFPDSIMDIVPDIGPTPLARRLEAVLGLASAIALLRQTPAGGCAGNPPPAINGTLDDVRDAVQLLLAADVADDGPAISQRTVEFLRLLRSLSDQPDNPKARSRPASPVHRVPADAKTVGYIQKQLAAIAYAGRAAQVVNESKRQGRAAVRPGEVTRRVIDRHLMVLRDQGLVASGPGRDGQKWWWLTAAGREFAEAGGVSVFRRIADALNAIHPADTSRDPGFTQPSPSPS